MSIYFYQSSNIDGYKEYRRHPFLNEETFPIKSTSSLADSEVRRYASSVYLKAPSSSSECNIDTLLDEVRSLCLLENELPPSNLRKRSFTELSSRHSDITSDSLSRKNSVSLKEGISLVRIPRPSNLEDLLRQSDFKGKQEICSEISVSYRESLYISKSLSSIFKRTLKNKGRAVPN